MEQIEENGPMTMMMPSTSAPTTATTLISQELFDETILENEETFDLSPQEALIETIDQFCQQLGVDGGADRGKGGGDNEHDADAAAIHLSRVAQHPALSHLVLSHPDSTEGRRDRENRTKFQNCLDLLDGCVNTDGSLKIDEIVNEDKNVDGDESLGRKEVLGALNEVANRCQFGDDWVPEKPGEENNIANNMGSSSNSSSPFPYLAIFQRTSSIYTLMSFLGVVDPSLLTEQQNDSTSCSRAAILQATIRSLSSILSLMTFSVSPSLVNCTNIRKCARLKAELRDLFVPALGLVVSLIGGYLKLVRSEMLAPDLSISDIASDGKRFRTEKSFSTAETILVDLLRLGIDATRGCESAKVAFVQSTLPSSLLVERDEEKSPVGNESSQDNGHVQRGGVKVLVSCLSLRPLIETHYGDQTDDMGDVQIFEVLTESCHLLASLCRYDDFRDPSSSSSMMGAANVNVSSAHDHAMEFYRAGAIPLLIRIAREVLSTLSKIDSESDVIAEHSMNATRMATNEKLSSAVLTSLRVLAVNDEIVQTMVALGVLPIVTDALKSGVSEALLEGAQEKDNENSENFVQNGRASLIRKQRLTAASMGLLRNLCGNDEIKTNLCMGNTSMEQNSSSISSTPSVLPHLLKAMQIFSSSVPQIQEHACGTLAAMALRRPANARAIIDAGGPRWVLLAMKQNERNVNVQRQGALAIRNLVSRLLKGVGSDVPNGGSDGGTSSGMLGEYSIRDIFLDLGAEDVLRNIAGRHQGSVDEAYAALRDLGCSVSLLKFDQEDASQVVHQRTMMFGEKHNSNFRAVYEESAGLADGVDNAISEFGAC